jgi:tetratricopeptide (TPR) repeat protein
VVPYLRAAYPEEMDRLEAWVEDHGLVRLSLEKLAKNAHIVEELARDVARGVPPSDRLLGFARNLESSDMLDEALRCLAAVLRDEPAHVGGLTLLVEMLGDRGRHGQAMFVAACVLALDEHNVEVLQVAARTLESLGGLHEARAAIDRILELEQFTEWHHEWALLQRASEAFRLGDVDAARSDAQLFRRELMSRLARRQLESLRAELAASDTSTTDDAHHP